jgi:hypothetical protein
MVKVDFPFPDLGRCIMFPLYTFNIHNIVLPEICPIAPTHTTPLLMVQLLNMGPGFLRRL